MQAYALVSSTQVHSRRAQFIPQRASSKHTVRASIVRAMSGTNPTAVNKTANGQAKNTEGFRDHIAPGTEFPPESGRYHLYVCYACPWAGRALTALNIKGLQDVIGVSVTHPVYQRTQPDNPHDTHWGWAFVEPTHPPLVGPTGYGSFGCDDCTPDTVNGKKFLRDIYEMSNDQTGQYTVPVLWDKKTGVIVNNDSGEIIRILNSAFNDFASHPEIDLYPEPLRKEIDEVNSWVHPAINVGVYSCAFATEQQPYEQAFRELFAALDKCEERLSQHRYIVGNQLTEADIRLFQTLIRFDEVAVVAFKTNKKFIREYPNLRGYVRDLYQTPGFSANMRHIKLHYFTSYPTLNKYSIIPVGGESWWQEPHNRLKQYQNAKQAWEA